MCTVNKMWMTHNQLNERKWMAVSSCSIENCLESRASFLVSFKWVFTTFMRTFNCLRRRDYANEILSAICTKICWTILFPCSQPLVLFEFWFKHLWNWLRFKLCDWIAWEIYSRLKNGWFLIFGTSSFIYRLTKLNSSDFIAFIHNIDRPKTQSPYDPAPLFSCYVFSRV